MISYLVSKIGDLAAKDMTNLASVMEGRLFSHEGGKRTWITVMDGTSPSKLEHLKSLLGEVKAMRLKVKIQNFPTCHVFIVSLSPPVPPSCASLSHPSRNKP